jgi:hypothetical protein
VETYVASVNLNKKYLLIKVAFDGVKVLYVHSDNRTGCHTTKLLKSIHCGAGVDVEECCEVT